MAGSGDVSVSLDLDAKKFHADLGEAHAALGKLASQASSAGDVTKQYNDAIGGAAGSHEKLLSSSHRVATQIGHLSRDLASGASGAQVFESAVIGLERSLHLPLGALAGLAAVGYVGKEIYDITVEAQKLREAIAAIIREGSQNPEYTSLTNLNKLLGETEKKIDEVQHKSTGIGLLLEAVGRSFTAEGKDKNLPDLIRDIGNERTGQSSELRTLEERTKSGVAGKAAEENKQERLKLDEGEFAAEREKIEAKGKEKEGAAIKAGNVELLAQVKEQTAIELEAINRKEAAKNREFELEKQIAEVKLNSSQVEIDTAKAKVAAAQAELAAPHSKEDEPKIQAKLADSIGEVSQAQEKADDKAEKESAKNELDVIGEDTASKLEEAEDQRKSREDEAAEAKRHAQDAERKKTTQTPRDLEAEHRALNPAALSLHDFATQGSGHVAALAQQAEREEKLARQRGLVGDLKGASEHQSHAEQLKKSLGLDNQVDRDALKKVTEESRDALLKIRDNTDGMGANK